MPTEPAAEGLLERGGAPGSRRRGKVRAVSGVLVARLVHDPLQRNALLLMVDQAVLGILGFFFWLLAAHHFSPTEIGSTVAALGVIVLLGSVATLGMPNTLLRYWGTDPDPVGMAAAAVGVAGMFGLVVGAIWVGILGHVGVRWAGGTVQELALGVAVAVSALGTLVSYGLMARRSAHQILLKDTFGMGLRYAALFLVMGEGMFGLVRAQILGAAGAMAIGVALMLRKITWHFHDWPGIWRRLGGRARFALGNHVSSLVAMIPVALLPALLVSRIGAKQSAYVSIPMMIISVLVVVPQATSNSMFAEISHDRDRAWVHIRAAMRSIYILLVPAVAAVVVLAPLVMSLFGRGYGAGTHCLQLMALGCVFAGANYVSDTTLLAMDRVRAYAVVNVCGTVAVLAGTLGLSGWGPTGVGLGWLLGQAGYLVVSMVAVVSTGVWRERRDGRSTS